MYTNIMYIYIYIYINPFLMPPPLFSPPPPPPLALQLSAGGIVFEPIRVLSMQLNPGGATLLVPSRLGASTRSDR